MSTQADQFWAGQPGDQYRERQNEAKLLRSYEAMWRRILAKMRAQPNTVLEIGANVGLNLDALKWICPDTAMTGIEPNVANCAIMRSKGHAAIETTIQNWMPTGQWDMVFTRGVLIHTPPAYLQDAYAKIYEASKRWIVLAEYFSTKLEPVEYRGQMGLLWKGPHAYQLMKKYPNLRLIDYGFVSSRDPEYPQDDLNWWLLEKRV